MKSLIYSLSILIITIVAGCKSNNKVLSDTYQPQTPGSTWTYKAEMTGGITDELTETISKETEIFDGKVYHKSVTHVKSKDSLITNYFRNENGKYYSLSAGPGKAGNIKFTYLYDALGAGGGWSDGMSKGNSLLNFNLNSKGKIIEAGISKTINGKTYNDIIHSQVTVTFSLKMDINMGMGINKEIDTMFNQINPGNLNVDTTTDFYVAKGIGVVEWDVASGNTTIKQTLLHYDIK